MRGTCRRFGDSINTDEIIPARYLNTTDPQALARHCMEDADPDFVKNASQGDIIVAGRNFGCGSSREHAPIAIQAFGISCVIAESFARIFFRNAVNIGLPIIECAEAASEAEDGDDIEVDIDSGVIINHSQGKRYEFRSFGKDVRRIIEAGGLIPFVKDNLMSNRG